MLNTYYTQQNESYDAMIQKTLSTMPVLFREYYDALSTENKSRSTTCTYLRNVSDFLSFLLSSTISTPISEQEFQRQKKIFDLLQQVDRLPQYLREYLNAIQQENASKAVLKSRLVALRSFVVFLQRKDYISEEIFYQCIYVFRRQPQTIPTLIKQKPLSEDEISLLLQGIQKNDKYLLPSSKIEVCPIEQKVWIKRERLVIRNLSIISLLADTGLRLSELVSLDVSDVDLCKKEVAVRNNDQKQHVLQFSPRTAHFLDQYLNGVPMPPLYYEYQAKNLEYIDFCVIHRMTGNFRSAALQEFGPLPSQTIQDLIAITAAIRRQGRESLRPQKNCQALFISNRGLRLSGRSIETTVKELVMTYLPSIPGIKDFSPSSLRVFFAAQVYEEVGGDMKRTGELLRNKNEAITKATYGECVKREIDREKSQN